MLPTVRKNGKLRSKTRCGNDVRSGFDRIETIPGHVRMSGRAGSRYGENPVDKKVAFHGDKWSAPEKKGNRKNDFVFCVFCGFVKCVSWQVGSNNDKKVKSEEGEWEREKSHSYIAWKTRAGPFQGESRWKGRDIVETRKGSRYGVQNRSKRMKEEGETKREQRMEGEEGFGGLDRPDPALFWIFRN